MECVYINLDGQAERRAFLESNFAAHNSAGWPLARISAVGSEEVRQLGLPGRLRDPEKGALLSHRKALTQVLPGAGHALILEDDVLFGPDSCERIQSAAGTLDDAAWDMIFTDVSVVEPDAMARLFSLRRQLMRAKKEMLLPLRDIPFCGSSAYLVHQRFKPRLQELLLRQASLDWPIDLHLRRLIHEGEIRAFVTFPFVTSLSRFADQSQSQLQDGAVTDTVWNAFRRFIWLHRDIDAALAPLEALGADFADPEARAFAGLMAAALSENMVFK